MINIALILAFASANSLQILDPAVRRIVDVEAHLTEVARGQTWTEGPLPLDDGRLLFADIKSNSIRVVNASGAVEVLRQPSGYLGPKPYPGPEPGSSAMIRDKNGDVIVAGHAGRAIYRFRGLPSPAKTRVTLVGRFEGRRFNSPNDLTLGPNQSIWFTDPPFGLPTQKAGDPDQDLAFSGIYRLSRAGRADQKLELMSRALAGPNGLAFSPDQRTLYVTDTPTKTWVKFEVGADGRLDGPKPFAKVGDDARPGEPDGLAVDRLGHVFAAGPGGVWVFDPAGRHLGTIIVPKKTSNVAFSGRKLFITASDSIYTIDTKTGVK